MIDKMRVMIYVDDINLNRDFWQTNFNAEITDVLDLPGGYTGITLSLNRDFVKEYSPEVADNVPSLMLFTDNFKQIRSRLDNPGEIMVQAGLISCNFADPDGNYFVLAKKQAK
jgi:hypothetical protein